MSRLLHIILLSAVHLLLVAFLLGALLCLTLQRTELQQFYLARGGAGLATLLLAWVGVLLVQQLRRQQWVAAAALALVAVADGLALCGSIVLLATTGAMPGPS